MFVEQFHATISEAIYGACWACAIADTENVKIDFQTPDEH